MTEDILTTLIAYIVTVSGFLLWTFVSKQDRISRTCRTVVMVAARTLPLFVLLLVICRGLSVSVLTAMVVLTLFLLVLVVFGGFGPSLGAVVILYVLKQWILGWPDKQDMLLEPPSANSNEVETLSDLIGQLGITSSALRPAGNVTVEGQRYAALSDGGYIESGEPVEIIGRRGSQLVVQLPPSDEKGPLRCL